MPGNLWKLFGPRGQPKASPLPMHPCVETAPEKPNAWTDGSKTFPCQPQWSLAGYGVYYPARAAEDLTRHERSIANETAIGSHLQGTGLSGGLAGRYSSSTRAEAVSGLVAINAPGAVHIGTDSEVFAIRLQGILDKPTDMHRRPWLLLKDGDVWQAIHASVTCKGAQAIRVTWVKGHATQEHIILGKATKDSLIGNATADLLADQGVQVGIQDGITQLCSYYAAK